MNFEINPKEVSTSFEQMARQLINEYQLQVNHTLIDLCDLEFYWNDKATHNDESTHVHNYRSGQLRPHGSGLDIALNQDKSYGGILIRGIKAGDKAVYGPLLSAEEILNHGVGLLEGEGLRVRLVRRETPSDKLVFKTTRIGLGKNAGEHADLEYRFVKCDSAYLNAVKGKEALCRAMVEAGILSREEAIKALDYTPKDWKTS